MFDDFDIYFFYILLGVNDLVVDFENGLSYDEIMVIVEVVGVVGFVGGYVDKYLMI